MEDDRIGTRFYDREDNELPVFIRTVYRASSSDGGWKEFDKFMDAVEYSIKENSDNVCGGFIGKKNGITKSFKFLKDNIVIVRRSQIGNPFRITRVEYEELWPAHSKEENSND